MKQIYNFFKVKMCYRTYWKQWLAFFFLFNVCIFIVLFMSSCNDTPANTTQKMLDAKEEEIDEKIRIAKESKRIQDSPDDDYQPQIDMSE